MSQLLWQIQGSGANSQAVNSRLLGERNVRFPGLAGIELAEHLENVSEDCRSRFVSVQVPTQHAGMLVVPLRVEVEAAAEAVLVEATPAALDTDDPVTATPLTDEVEAALLAEPTTVANLEVEPSPPAPDEIAEVALLTAVECAPPLKKP